MTNDIKTRKLYEEIAAMFNLEASDIDGDEFAEAFTLEQLAILQKEIAKAITRKVLD
jgi:3-methyladenine DNA glycosylase AlkD